MNHFSRVQEIIGEDEVQNKTSFAQFLEGWYEDTSMSLWPFHANTTGSFS